MNRIYSKCHCLTDCKFIFHDRLLQELYSIGQRKTGAQVYSRSLLSFSISWSLEGPPQLSQLAREIGLTAPLKSFKSSSRRIPEWISIRRLGKSSMRGWMWTIVANSRGWRESSCASQPGVFQFRAEMFVRRADKIIQENSREERERERARYQFRNIENLGVSRRKKEGRRLFFTAETNVCLDRPLILLLRISCAHTKGTHTHVLLSLGLSRLVLEKTYARAPQVLL